MLTEKLFHKNKKNAKKSEIFKWFCKWEYIKTPKKVNIEEKGNFWVEIERIHSLIF